MKAETFDPDEWKTAWDSPAFYAMTPADAYWGAKIVSSYTDDHLRGGRARGQFPEAWVADSLVSVLAVRRDAVVRRFFSSVTPLESPRISAASLQSLTLTFRDLGLDKRVWGPAATQYT